MNRLSSRAAIAILLAATFAAAQQGAPIPQQLTFAPYHANGIYQIGETVGWAVARDQAAR